VAPALAAVRHAVATPHGDPVARKLIPGQGYARPIRSEIETNNTSALAGGAPSRGRTEREALLEDYLPFGEIVRLPRPLPAPPVACRDRDDAVFPHLALAAGADFLVSGDQDLAALRRAAPLAILAPGALAARFSPG